MPQTDNPVSVLPVFHLYSLPHAPKLLVPVRGRAGRDNVSDRPHPYGRYQGRRSPLPRQRRSPPEGPNLTYWSAAPSPPPSGVVSREKRFSRPNPTSHTVLSMRMRGEPESSSRLLAIT